MSFQNLPNNASQKSLSSHLSTKPREAPPHNSKPNKPSQDWDSNYATTQKFFDATVDPKQLRIQAR